MGTTGSRDCLIHGGLRSVGVAMFIAAASALYAPTALSAQDAGTIKPGQSEADVKAAWGNPITERKSGIYTYMFYENGCLKTCGTYDVVILENDQVVDAIVRAENHKYDGVSSSPSDRKPGPTNVKPGTT
jgi:hypothetical protein